MEIQEQIYVIWGVCAGLFLLLFIFIGYLMYRVAKITEILVGKQIEKRDTYAYNNPVIVPGEELNRRGFLMHNGGGSAPSSMSRDPAPLTSLPRLDSSYERGQSQNDFSSILNNNDTVFMGDRPSNLMARNKGQPQQMRSAAPNQDYNYGRSAIANDNFSFQNGLGDRGSDVGPKNYLNERMQY